MAALGQGIPHQEFQTLVI